MSEPRISDEKLLEHCQALEKLCRDQGMLAIFDSSSYSAVRDLLDARLAAKAQGGAWDEKAVWEAALVACGPSAELRGAFMAGANHQFEKSQQPAPSAPTPEPAPSAPTPADSPREVQFQSLQEVIRANEEERRKFETWFLENQAANPMPRPTPAITLRDMFALAAAKRGHTAPYVTADECMKQRDTTGAAK